jgi:hypothetical protein
LQEDPWVGVEMIGEQLEHSGDVLAGVFPVGTVAFGIELCPFRWE